MLKVVTQSSSEKCYSEKLYRTSRITPVMNPFLSMKLKHHNIITRVLNHNYFPGNIAKHFRTTIFCWTSMNS